MIWLVIWFAVAMIAAPIIGSSIKRMTEDRK